MRVCHGGIFLLAEENSAIARHDNWSCTLPNQRPRTIVAAMSALQIETERRGEQIFELVDRHPESIFSKAGFYQRMMAISMKDEAFKV